MKRLTALIGVLMLAAALLTGCSASAKTYDTGAGMSLSLPGNFKEYSVDGQTAAYESNKAIVTVLKETFTDLENAGLELDEASAVEDYAQIVMVNNGLYTTLEEKDGVTYFVYEMSVDDYDISYMATVTKGSDAFWLVQFACESKNFEKQQPDFISWAKSIRFGDETPESDS